MAEVWGKDHLTAKEVKHLAEFRHYMHSNKGYGDWTLAVLSWAVQNWSSFLKECAAGWKSTKGFPDKPSTKFLCDDASDALAAAIEVGKEAAEVSK